MGELSLQGHLVSTKRGGLWATSKKRLCRIAVVVGTMALPFCHLPTAQASIEQDRASYPRFSPDVDEAIELYKQDGKALPPPTAGRDLANTLHGPP